MLIHVNIGDRIAPNASSSSCGAHVEPPLALDLRQLLGVQHEQLGEELPPVHHARAARAAAVLRGHLVAPAQ